MRLKILFFLLLIFNLPRAWADNRILVKLPFAEREIVLKSMRSFLKQHELMLASLAKEDYLGVEKAAATMLLHPKMLERIGTRENDKFMEMAVDFHTNGLTPIIAAARKKDSKQILTAMSSFVSRCNSCHETFKFIEWPAKDYPFPKAKKLAVPKGYNRREWFRKEFMKKEGRKSAPKLST